jgi:outer membrane protein assembly factor BamB
LRTGRLEPLDLEAARRHPPEKASAELKQWLAETRAPRPQRQPVSIAPARMVAFPGRYRSRGEGAPVEASVSADADTLVVEVAGAPALRLRPVGEDLFESADGGALVGFFGRGGSVESMIVNRGGDVTSMAPAFGPAPESLRTAATAPDAAGAPRGAPRPWPGFRGENAAGNGDGQGAPTTWDVAAGKNVRFRTPIPGMGNASPIVWGERVFVTTAVSAKGDRTFRPGLYGDGTSVDDLSEHSFRLLALDAKSGKVLWDREVHKSPPGAKRHLKSSQANSTPVTDGKRVVVLFGAAGVLAAYDLEGKALWKREIGVLDCGDEVFGNTEWGHGSSPVIYKDVVLIQADTKGASFLAAYRLSDGSEMWKVPRDEASTWSTPNVLPAAAGDEIVVNGRTVRGYEASSGKLLWTLAPNSQNVVASPIIGDGMAFVTAGYPPVRPIYAIRSGKRGDLSLPAGQTASDAVAWSHPRGGSYIPTPLLYRGEFYTLNSNGIFAGYRADTGERLFEGRIGAGQSAFSASPVAADGRIFVASENGEVYVVKAGSAEVLAKNDMGEVVMASPAISDGLLVVRTLGHVVALAESGPER